MHSRVFAGDSAPELAREWAELRKLPDHIDRLCGPLAQIVELLHEANQAHKRKDTLERSLTLNNNPQRLQLHGYRHCRLYASAANTILAEIAGVQFSFTTVVGWNPVDWPDNTIVSSAKISPAYDLYVLQLTDEKP